MTEPAMTRQTENDPRNNTRYSQIYEIISRQRYSTEQLLKHLKGKRAAFSDGDFSLADRLESGIARLAATIAHSIDTVQRLLAGQSLETFSEGFPEHMRAPLASEAAEISRLEWLCLKELNGIKTWLQKNAGACECPSPSGQQFRRNTQANG